MATYYVYILSSGINGTLYIGMTNNIQRRMYEHKNNLIDGFTQQYDVHLLVYLEETNSAPAAIQREKQLKNWRRTWKANLINEANPQWRDLAEDFEN